MTKRILTGILLSAAAAGAADLSGLIFYDYTHDATRGVPSGEVTNRSFNVGRAYLTVTSAPSENLACKLQFDVGQLKSYKFEGDIRARLIDSDGDTLRYSLTNSDAGFYAYVKNASVEWTNDLGKWTFGVQGMNLFNVQEATFGNRFLAKPLMDERGFSSSADLGAGYSNRFADLVTASVLYTNGGGYKKTESNKYKKLSLQVVAGEPALNKKDGWNAGLVYSLEPTSADYSTTVLGLLGGWAGSGARVGVEYDSRTTGGATDVTSTILGFYGDYKLPFAPGWSVVGSFDAYDPDTDSSAKNNETSLIVGAKWQPVKGLVLCPNLKTVGFEDSSLDALTYYRVSFEVKI
jgi:hypothetical protein